MKKLRQEQHRELRKRGIRKTATEVAQEEAEAKQLAETPDERRKRRLATARTAGLAVVGRSGSVGSSIGGTTATTSSFDSILGGKPDSTARAKLPVELPPAPEVLVPGSTAAILAAAFARPSPSPADLAPSDDIGASAGDSAGGGGAAATAAGAAGGGGGSSADGGGGGSSGVRDALTSPTIVETVNMGPDVGGLVAPDETQPLFTTCVALSLLTRGSCAPSAIFSSGCRCCGHLALLSLSGNELPAMQAGAVVMMTIYRLPHALSSLDGRRVPCVC